MMECEQTSFMSMKRLLFGLLSAVSMLNFLSEWWHWDFFDSQPNYSVHLTKHEEMTESFCMLSVAPKGTVHCRMVVSCVFCPEIWRKIFLAFASGMLISQVKRCKSSAFPTSSGKYGDFCCSRSFLTTRHGCSSCVWHRLCQGSVCVQGELCP